MNRKILVLFGICIAAFLVGWAIGDIIDIIFWNHPISGMENITHE